MSDDVVYQRDATAWDRPATTGGRVYHWPSEPDPVISACGQITLNPYGVDPARVAVHTRCRKAGCRHRWAAFDRRDTSTPDPAR